MNRAIVVPLVGGDYALSVELGFEGMGVFVTTCTRDRRSLAADAWVRRATWSIGETQAKRLATVLLQAAEASEANSRAKARAAP